MTLSDEYVLEPFELKQGGTPHDIVEEREPGTRCCAVFLRDASASMTAQRDELARETYEGVEEQLAEVYPETDIIYALYGEGIKDTVDRDTFYEKQQQPGGENPEAAYRDALDLFLRRSDPGDDRYVVMATDRETTVLGLEDYIMPSNPAITVHGTAYLQVDFTTTGMERERRPTDDGFVTVIPTRDADYAANSFRAEVEQVREDTERMEATKG